jgi:hypothetical protein
MQLSEEGGCVNWDTGWHSDPSLHKQNTSILPAVGSGWLEPPKHSGSQQWESGKCWGVASPVVAE